MPLAPGAALVLPLQDVALSGMTSEGPMGGLGLSDGELSGHVLLDDFFNAYNVAAEALCGTCANLTGDVYTINAKTGEWEATGCATDTYACVLPDEMSCATLVSDDFLGGGVCGLIPGIIGGVADLDLDGDGTFESLSAGIRTAGVPGEIVGVQ